MRIVFLPSAARSLLLLRDRLAGEAPQGRARAQDGFLALLKTLRSPDVAAREIEGRAVRAHHIAGTPLSLLFLARDGRIEVLEVRGQGHS